MSHINLARAAALLSTAVPFAFAACGGGSESSWQGSVADSAGIEVVTNTGSGTWGPDEAWTIEQDLVIGTAEGEPEYQFGQIAGLDVGSDGRIYVVDQQAREIRVFSPTGEFVARMGRAGSGPGELSPSAGPLFVGPGDTVAVPDAILQRVNRYTADGEPVASYPIPLTEGIPARWMEAPNEDLIQQAMVIQFPGQENVEPKNLILRRAPSGAILDTVLELPIGGSLRFTGNTPDITLFESEPVWAMGPDGSLYFGTNSEYRLQVYSPDGELLRIVQKPVERRPVTDGDQAEFRRILRTLWGRQGVQPQAMEMLMQRLKFAEFYPAFANVLGGPDGSLWVQGLQTPEAVREQGGTFDIQDIGGADWEVYDDGGRLLGVVRMPPRFTPVAFHGDEIYGLLRDEMDVQYAARMTLNRGPTVRAD